MACALLKAGFIWEADKAFNSSTQSVREALAMVQAAAGGLGVNGNEEMRSDAVLMVGDITDSTMSGISMLSKERDGRVPGMSQVGGRLGQGSQASTG